LAVGAVRYTTVRTMTADEFQAFRHKAVHRLMDLNEDCEHRFGIGHWERWDYDLDAGTLVFSDDGLPRVVAKIQAVGTTSTASKTWLWGWANESLSAGATLCLREVREFGTQEDLPQLTEPNLADDEYLGWELTAIAAQILQAKGAYRCPSENGFLYLLYTDVTFADSVASNTQAVRSDDRIIECRTHGIGQMTFVCEHLAGDPKREWFSDVPTSSKPWPDAWCNECDQIYQEQGEWNDNNSGRIEIKLLCHRCYESLRVQATTLP
jgi:hypothetical protein